MTDLRYCKKCNTEKRASSFYKSQINECKECTKTRVKSNDKGQYDKTEKGVIRVIYKTQRLSSIRRGHQMPSYSKDELSYWLYNNGFKALYCQWVNSGYKKDLKPSVDRINDYKNYSFNNIKLSTWLNNRLNQYNCKRLNKGLLVYGVKVAQYEKNGKLIKIFDTQTDASKATGVNNKNISAVCNGKRKHAGGFAWRHIEAIRF